MGRIIAFFVRPCWVHGARVGRQVIPPVGRGCGGQTFFRIPGFLKVPARAEYSINLHSVSVSCVYCLLLPAGTPARQLARLHRVKSLASQRSAWAAAAWSQRS